MAKENKPKLSGLLQSIGINKVIYVDDIFGDTHTVEDFLGLVEANYDNHAQQFGRFSRYFQLSDQSQVRTTNIREYWDENSVEKRIELFSILRQILPEQVDDIIVEDDTNTVNALLNHLSGDILTCLTPQEWDAQKDTLLQNSAEVFCIFDQELGEPTRKGFNLLENEIGAGNNLLCCILTNETLIKNEEEYRNSLCAGTSIQFQQLITLAKERAQKPNSIADGIKKSLLINHWEKIRRETLSVIDKAFNKTTQDIENKFDAFIFDDVVLKSSAAEGVSEGETIFRLSNILYQKYAKEECITGDFYTLLSEEVKKARLINGYNFIVPSPSYAFELRHLELFEEGQTLNKLFSPLSNGDIFKIDSEYFILAGQPCDLMERENGERNSTVATLLKLKIVPYKEYGALASHKNWFPLFYFDKSTSNVGMVNFKDHYFIDFDVIDLAIFNDNGKCTLDVNGQECPAQIHIPWQKKFIYLKERYGNRVANFKELLDSIEGIGEDGKKELLKKLIFSTPTLPKLNLNENYFDGENVFDFGIERVQHLKEPRSGLLLKTFNRYLSRDAESHDFASALAK